MLHHFKSLKTIILSIVFILNTLFVNSQSATLKHAYTFDNNQAEDSIGDAHGKIHGNAQIINGSFVTASNGDYLELPADKINLNTYISFSIEVFIVAGKRNDSYTMLTYFGNQLNKLGLDYFFLSLINNGNSRTAIACKNEESTWMAETGIRSRILADDKPHHVVTTLDNKVMKLYIDGVLAGTSTIPENSNNLIENMGSDFAYLCKGGFDSDPTWQGKIDRFNIYEGILDSATIAKTALDYLPNHSLARAKAFLKGPKSNMAVDESGTFAKPLTGEHIIFAEIVPLDYNENNRIDECLLFSDGTVHSWEEISTGICFNSIYDYILAIDGSGTSLDQITKTAIEVGQVYQCWFQLNVIKNTYSLFVKTVDQKKPVLIWKNAKFRKNATTISQWNVVHNSDVENDEMKTQAISEVSKVGEFPNQYLASKPNAKKSVLDEELPKNARVIENPRHGYQTGVSDLKKLVLTDDETILYFRAYHSSRDGISIPAKTYIKQGNSDEKLYVTASEGVPMKIWYYASANGHTDYKLTFPAIDANTKTLDFGEGNSGGSWFIYDIEFTPKPNTTSNALSGNWFNTTTGNWEFSLLDTIAIYNNGIWNHTGFEPEKNKGSIILFRGNTSVTLQYHRKKDKLMLGEKDHDMHVLDQVSRYNTVSNPDNPSAFEKPIFKMDTAEFSGLYYGFKPNTGPSTGQIFVDNVFTGNQENYLVKINDDGRFSVKIPITYPHEVYVRMDRNNVRLFLEPGKKVFMLMNLTERTDLMVMGANARLISELTVQNKWGFDFPNFYNDIPNKILNMSAVDYKQYCMQQMEKDLLKLQGIYDHKMVSDRFFQVMQAEIKSNYMRNALRYNSNSQIAYRRLHQIPNEQRELPVEFENPTEKEYYDFLEAGFMNDELSLLAATYENLINAFKYSPVIWSTRTPFNYLELLKDSTIVKSEDKVLVENLMKHYTDTVQKLNKDYYTNYGKTESKLRKEYSDDLIKISKSIEENEGALILLLEHVSQLDTIIDEYRIFCAEALKYYNNPDIRKSMSFFKKNQNETRTLYDKYKPYNDFNVMLKRSALLDTIFLARSTFVPDLFNAQDMLRSVVSNLTPMPGELLTHSQQYINDPFIREYITVANNATLATIEANKSKGGHHVNAVPETEADKLFEAIIEKYRGKVIYVDFWATWCGPCRSSMTRQMTMKESLKDKDIVFVYITNPSSPEAVYNNMIPNIHGEHYRLSQDEWNYLGGKFKISGIPHYLIVNKKGEVVDANAPREPSVLLSRFEELMKE